MAGKKRRAAPKALAGNLLAGDAKQRGGGGAKASAGAGSARPAGSRSRARRKPRQAELPFRSWGGARKGAGRKPKGPVALVGHDTRAAHAATHPALVTVKLRQRLPRLRDPKVRAVLLTHFARGKDRFGFRLLHFAILNDHLHFVVEAKDRTALARGLQGLLIRLARGLNKLWARKGKVFADRYHDRALKSPREVRNALVYVLGNARKHLAQGRKVEPFHGPDVFSSAPWFDGFVESLTVHGIEHIPIPTAVARTWLAAVGWRRLGRLGFDEVPKLA